MSTQTLPKASYTGPSGGLKKSTVWLSSEDIAIDSERIVRIQDVELHRNVQFEKGRTGEKVPALKFHDEAKHMILNSTNRKMLVRLFGTDTTSWREKVVALYVDPDVKMAGKTVNGLRIRPAPDGAKPGGIEQKAPAIAPLTPMQESVKAALAKVPLGERTLGDVQLEYFGTRKWSEILAMPEDAVEPALLKLKAIEGVA